MNKIIILVTLFAVAFTFCSAEEMISEEQDSQNKKYLILLNDNIITTIQVLEAFNEQASEIYLIQNGEYYNAFLMDMAMQCSNLINEIRNAELMSELEREMQIRALLATIKPDVEFTASEVDSSTEDQSYLESVNLNLTDQIISIQKALLSEEETILEKGEVTQNYLRLHTHYFLFSLILDFIEPSEYLGKLNLNYLVRIVRSVDEALPKE